MMKCAYPCVAVASLLLCFYGVFQPKACGDVTLPRVFSDHMVLQRDRPLPIWGWADPGEAVTVSLDAASPSTTAPSTTAPSNTTTADANGHWKVVLPALQADGKTHSLTITGKNKIDLQDILIGEVWIGSGQSNMGFRLSGSTGGKEAIAAADYPEIRLLHVAHVRATQPATDISVDDGNEKDNGKSIVTTGPGWKLCSPKSVPDFSAVLFYFGQRLHKELTVPIGLIDSSWASSRIEAWTVSLPRGSGMYNAMIAPLQPFAIRGAIWYQGEANVNDKIGPTYAEKMKTLINGWRQTWGEDLSFYFVQIAPFGGRNPGTLPALWECQDASLKIPGTGMAVITDLVDDIKNIHPKNKFDVGNRLALWALAKDYGRKDIVYSGPIFKSMKVEGKTIRLSFAHVGSGLKSRDGKPLSEFEIAAADGKFVPADAVIDGETIVVSAKEIPAPTQARFGWRNEAQPNFINKEGLPAAPFETEHWQGGTGE